MSVQLFKYVGCIKLSALILAIATAGAAAVPEASAQGFSIYPTQGQSQDQLNRDRYECHNWAVGQSRCDPTRAQYSAPPQEGQVAGGNAPLRAGSSYGFVPFFRSVLSIP
jgi:hypothetical protein